LTASFAAGLGLFFSESCFKALAKAFLTIASFASSDNSALESVLAFYSLFFSTGLSFYLMAKAALIVF